jgi:hypothetical protein
MSSSERCVDCESLFFKEWNLIKNDDETKKQNFLKKRFEILCIKCTDIKLIRKIFAQPEPRTPKINIERLEQNYSWSANYPDKWY